MILPRGCPIAQKNEAISIRKYSILIPLFFFIIKYSFQSGYGYLIGNEGKLQYIFHKINENLNTKNNHYIQIINHFKYKEFTMVDRRFP